MPLNALSTTAGSASFNLYTSIVGGLEGALIAPTTTVLTTDMTQRFAVGRAAQFFYCVDTSHNLLMWDAQNPTTPPAIIVNAATIGDQIVYLDVALDNSFIVATTVGNKVLKILTAAPYTVSTLAGSGNASSTDGTGSAAAFNQPSGICVDIINGLYAYVWDVNTGNVRRIVLSTGVVMTLKNGVGSAMTSPISMAKSGRIYFMNNSGQSVNYTSLYGKPGGANVGSFPGVYIGAIAVDDAEPTETAVYGFIQNALYMSRYDVATGVSLPNVATVPNIVKADDYGTQCIENAFFRDPAVYVVDASGNLLQIRN